MARPAVADSHLLMAGQPRRFLTGPSVQRAGIVAFAAALMLGIFWLDLSTQLGTAVGALFSVAVLVIAFTRSPLLIYLAASAACMLVVLGLMLAPSSQIPWSVVGANRVIYIGLAWISALLVVKIERARRTIEERDAKLALLAREDALTGVANRRRFDEQLGIEWRRAIRSKAPLSLLMIDIDHFKRYNDRNGHQAGDRCLARVAQAIHATLHRQADLVARYGGEEFAVLLPDTDGAGATELAEETRRAVEALALAHSSQGREWRRHREHRRGHRQTGCGRCRCRVSAQDGGRRPVCR